MKLIKRLEYTTELIFQKGLMLMKQVCQKNVIFITIDILEGIGFKYEPHLCNGCHDLMQKAMSFNNLAIVHVKGSAYRIHCWYISKDDAINIMNGSNLADNKNVLLLLLLLLFSLYIKLRENTDLTYQRHSDVILNKAKDYYKNDQERLREQARNKYRNLSEEEKNKKREFGKNRYLNMSEEKKQRLKEYERNYRESKKSQYNNK